VSKLTMEQEYRLNMAYWLRELADWLDAGEDDHWPYLCRQTADDLERQEGTAIVEGVLHRVLSEEGFLAEFLAGLTPELRLLRLGELEPRWRRRD
jgi:hypothetical protein